MLGLDRLRGNRRGLKPLPGDRKDRSRMNPNNARVMGPPVCPAGAVWSTNVHRCDG
jgi:hypothetical protein